MSLSGVSSPLEQEPNNHAFSIGCVAKYCLIVSKVSILIYKILAQKYGFNSEYPNV